MKEKLLTPPNICTMLRIVGTVGLFTDPAADTAFLSSLYILRNNGCAGWNDRKSDEQYQ